jgi:SAM-dependent methyltransferase
VGTVQFTGKRHKAIPDSSEIDYEYWHRHLYATRFSGDRKVLDMACGEGYGSYLLSLNAQTVIGVDISQETINRAASRYIRDNLNSKSAHGKPPNGGISYSTLLFLSRPLNISATTNNRHLWSK